MRKHERMRTSCLCLPQDGGLPRGCQIFKIAQNHYVTTPLPLAALCIVHGPKSARLYQASAKVGLAWVAALRAASASTVLAAPRSMLPRLNGAEASVGSLFMRRR
jgi:hypothetical protein